MDMEGQVNGEGREALPPDGTTEPEERTSPKEPEKLTPDVIPQKAIELLKGAPPEVAQYIAHAYGQYALEDAIKRGEYIPKDKIPQPEQTKPEPTGPHGPTPEFKKAIKNLLREANEANDPTGLWWEFANSITAAAVTEAERKMEAKLQEEVGPLREQQNWSIFSQAEKAFFDGKADLDEDLKRDFGVLMRKWDSEDVGAPQVYALMQKYAAKMDERRRQTAETQAKQRSEANMTGFLESPQRGGFTSQAAGEHQTDDLRKKIREAHKNALRGTGDEAEARRLTARWKAGQ